MAFLTDIMDRLTAHLRTALAADGGSVTKQGSFYRDLLGGLSEDERRQLIAHCETHGCTATFGEAPMGGTTLTIRRNV